MIRVISVKPNATKKITRSPQDPKVCLFEPSSKIVNLKYVAKDTTAYYILMETGDYLLLENGDQILME